MGIFCIFKPLYRSAMWQSPKAKPDFSVNLPAFLRVSGRLPSLPDYRDDSPVLVSVLSVLTVNLGLWQALQTTI